MATYWVKSGTGGTDAGTSWANAAESIPGLMTAQAIAGGDIIYVHNTHAYTAGAAITWTLPETGTGTVRVLCVDGGDATGTSLVDGTVGALTTGASESTNGNFSFTISPADSVAAGLYVHGIQIKTGAGGNSSAADIIISSANDGMLSFSACTFWVDSTSSSANMTFGGNALAIVVNCSDCSFRFGATTQSITTYIKDGFWSNCLINASGSSPTTLFFPSGTSSGSFICTGCDFSLVTNLVDQAVSSKWRFFANNCTITTPVTGTHSGLAGPTYEFHACAAAGANADVLSYYKEDAFGVVEDDQIVYVTSSPAQGTNDAGTATSYSLKMTPSALALPYQPLYTPWVYVKVASTGSKTISMKAADTESAVLKNSELWLEVEYMGGAAPANSPQTALEGTFPLSGTYHDVTAAGSNLTDTGEAWTGIVETGTYTLSKTVTVDEQGYIRCRVGLGKDTTNPVYVDPKITVA